MVSGWNMFLKTSFTMVSSDDTLPSCRILHWWGIIIVSGTFEAPLQASDQFPNSSNHDAISTSSSAACMFFVNFLSTLQQGIPKGWAFDAAFKNDCSRLPWNDWQHLSKVSTHKKIFANEGNILLCDLSQHKVYCIQCINRHHWCFICDEQSDSLAIICMFRVRGNIACACVEDENWV